MSVPDATQQDSGTPRWSWSTGERGVNRVRAFEDESTRGVIFLEFYERQGSGAAKRQRISTRHADRERAKLQAEQLASKIRATFSQSRGIARHMDQPEEFIGVPELAKLIGVSYPTARSYVDRGRIASRSIAGRVVILRSDAIAFVAQLPAPIPRSRLAREIELKQAAAEVK